MSLAWRLLREAIEEGRIIIDTAGLKENVVEYMHSWFPPSPPVCKSAHEDCSMQSTEDLMEKTVHIHDLPSFEDDVELDVPVSETSEIPEIAEVEISPRKDDRLERYLNDAAEKMAAAKKYRKALLSGSTNKKTSRIKKRHNRIYQEIVQEKMSTKFAIPGEAFRDVVDEIMKEEFPEYSVENEALVALQRESEMMLTKMMCLAGHLANHASRETVRAKDFKFLTFLFRKNKEGCSFDS